MNWQSRGDGCARTIVALEGRWRTASKVSDPYIIETSDETLVQLSGERGDGAMVAPGVRSRVDAAR